MQSLLNTFGPTIDHLKLICTQLETVSTCKFRPMGQIYLIVTGSVAEWLALVTLIHVL